MLSEILRREDIKKTHAEPVTSSTNVWRKKYILLQLRGFTLYSYFVYT
jgi:hypothetical protein